MENGQQRMITTYEYGNPEADVVLIQLTGEHELAVLENEVKEIRKRASSGELDFRFIAAKVENWNDELSPWKAPAVFKNEDFGGGAAETLEKILALCTDPGKTYYIGDILWLACLRCGQRTRRIDFPVLRQLLRLCGSRAFQLI